MIVIRDIEELEGEKERGNCLNQQLVRNSYKLDLSGAKLIGAKVTSKSKAQEERLIYIDFFLYFFGSISRNDLITRFGIKTASATRDITLYREIMPDNLEYDTAKKTYKCSRQFKPRYTYNVHHVLTCIAHGFSSQHFHVQENALILCETPQVLNNPNVDVVSIITRAIKQNRVVKMTYTKPVDVSVVSLITREETNMVHCIYTETVEFVPFAFVDNGFSWHVRGFNRNEGEFQDNVLTRISKASMLDELPKKNETKEFDNQWNRIVSLELIPHPNMDNPRAVIADYNMIDGKKRVEMRAAVAGYFLRLWNVDCSKNRDLRRVEPDGREIGFEYQLCLRNLPALYDVKNANLAPGYQEHD